MSAVDVVVEVARAVVYMPVVEAERAAVADNIAVVEAARVVVDIPVVDKMPHRPAEGGNSPQVAEAVEAASGSFHPRREPRRQPGPRSQGRMQRRRAWREDQPCDGDGAPYYAG